MGKVYSKIMQQTSDVDWFGCDIAGNLFHVASGGGKVPKSISEDRTRSLDVNRFVTELKMNQGPVFVNSMVRPITEISNDSDFSNYVKTFENMSRKGFYSFDKTKLGDFSDENYHLVTKPGFPIDLDMLPTALQNVIKLTKLSIDINKVVSFSISQVNETDP